VRYVYIRELLELIAGTLLGLGLVWVVNRQWPGLFRGDIGYREWLAIGSAVGFLLATAWSARKVEQAIDHRVPPHQRKPPAFRDGRPFGVIAWRTRDATAEFLWLVMGAVVVLAIIWLAKTFVPGW
jgi:hypothetical protein